MIDELEDLLSGFSNVNHICCFLHINNLVARTLVQQFNIPKKSLNANDNNLDDKLCELAGDIDIEELQIQEALLEDAGSDEVDLDDSTEGWINEMAALSYAECEILQKSLWPVTLLLVKV